MVEKSNVEHCGLFVRVYVYFTKENLSVALEEQDNLKQRMQLLKDQYVNQFAMDFVEFSWLVKKYTNSIITVSKQ